MELTGEYRSTRGKYCPNANLSTTNPTSTVCCVLVFNNFNTTTHKVFTKFCIDECCEVDLTASA